ncbi:MAG TPA: N-acetyltransferase [Planosporangium sp.]|nr:N-acetyltransferase [Planosporangium sp.]
MTGVRIVDAVDRFDSALFVSRAHAILAGLVAGGAALGWTEPPAVEEIEALLSEVGLAALAGDAALRAAYDGAELVGLGYWRRYARPTHQPHADLERVAVDDGAQGRGVGRALTAVLVDAARESGIEVLTLDARGDNDKALALYRSLGFVQYGRLADFVAIGASRYDKVFYALDLRR